MRSIIVPNQMNTLNLSFLLLIIISLISSCCFVNSQQPYIRKASTGCSNTDPSTSVYGYTCNGETPTCQSYLTFRSQPPYNNVSSISALLAADPSQLAQINSVSLDSTFETASIVLVPVNCSCSSPYYEVNSSYVIKPNDKFITIANEVFEGLTTCVAVGAQNKNFIANSLSIGATLTVPLRCACPTKNQTDNGIKYLLSYVINWGDNVSAISATFNVDIGRTFQANGLSDQDTIIYPNTTLLVPLQTPPNSSQINQSPPTSLVQPPQPPSAGSPPPSKGSSSKSWIYAVVGVLAGLAVVTLFLVYFYCLRKKKEHQRQPIPVSNSMVETPSFESIQKPSPSENSEIWDSITNFAKSINVYTYKELQRATDDFSPSFWIKGSVYRGVINGDLAAIKKKTGDVSEEINLLNKINHFNVIRLSGVCFDEGQWYLVYEFASNGSLSDWINTQEGSDKKVLTWKQRIQIALDIATGLNYLHSYTNPPHVHKDLTSDNVFLDTDLRAKIGNIGLARSVKDDEGDFAMTRHIVGTKGYMAPEYLEHGLVSPKLDVYAFGVLLMEIVTGRDVSKSSSEIELPIFEDKEDNSTEKMNNFLDPSLKEDYPLELGILVIKLIDSCIQKNLSDRPSMHDVVQDLSTIKDTTLSNEYKLNVSLDK